MTHRLWRTGGIALAWGATLLLMATTANSQFGPMTCIECHADPAAGGFHGGFRVLTNLTQDQISVICMSCHDGSYTNPQGVTAPAAAVHQNNNPGAGRDEYGDFKANCLDCHTNHSPLIANDGTGTRNLMLIGRRVKEASTIDDFARIRKPIILDVNGDDGGTSTRRFQDDIQTGWECDSGISNDPACVESNPPAAIDGVRKVIFYLNITSSGTHFASSSPPYTGACNPCHTRTAHHRRDDSGGDHDHNVTKPCTNCHNHDAGWVNKGG